MPEHYASHGFIVLAPEHVEQFDWEWSGLVTASIDRPLDIKQTLDYAEEINAPGGDLAGQIDMENVAVVGHSFGGYTALAMAGAQYDLDAFTERCASLPEDDIAMFLMCMPLVGKEAVMAERAGLDEVPEGLWPSFGDRRVTAIVALAGDSYMFDEAGLAKITIPMMAIGATADTLTPYEWGSKPSYDFASSEKKALVTLTGAQHTFMFPLCEDMPWITTNPFYQTACFDPVWDRARSLDLTHHFSTAFLLDTLKGDAAAAAALAPAAVDIPGIEYQSEGYADKVLLILRHGSYALEYMLTNEVAVMTSMLEDAGFEVVVATVSGQPLITPSITVEPDMTLADVDVDEYAGVMIACMAAGIPGGDNPYYPAAAPSRGAVEIVTEAVAAGKPVAAQYGSVAILSGAGVLGGKNYAYEHDEFPEGHFMGHGVIQDGNIITSGTCPMMKELTGREDGTPELTLKLIQSLN